MRVTFLTLALLFAFPIPQTPQPTASQTLTSGIDTSLRGLSSSAANNTKILWATGSNGVVLRSPDAGKSWNRLHIDKADTQDFRGVQSFGADIAYVFSVGNDNKSHVYKTSDAGKTWRTQYSDPRPAFFLDGLVCRSERICFAISDPIDGKFPILHTEDGEHWTELPQVSEPPALPTEGLFAASNTSLVLCGPGKTDILFATGGPAARVFHSADNAKTWSVVTTPVLSGNPSAGIFSLACEGRNVVAVGGDYRNPTATKSVAAYSNDLGATWHLADHPPAGYRSAVTSVNAKTWIAAGTNGTDISTDAGVLWTSLNQENANTLLTLDQKRVLTAGPKGAFTQLALP
ncbi:MAG TPA: YCF48-related protein [Candidatus Eremiobacteraceae bacterium]|nr:YCF48-related protein [Candidatus Eremiobacteraceae bacterium]